MKKIILLLVIFSSGISYDYLINLDKNTSYLFINNVSLNNVSFDFFINLDQQKVYIILKNYTMKNISYDFFVNLDKLFKNFSLNHNLSNLSYDYFVNLDHISSKLKNYFNLSNLNYDYFIILNETGILLSNSSIQLIYPLENQTFNLTNNVSFVYKVFNYTGFCKLVLDLNVINSSFVDPINNTVNVSYHVSKGLHNWFVICNNTISESRNFYVNYPEIVIFSPDSLENQGSILFDIKVLTNNEGNISSVFKVIDLNNNSIIENVSFSKLIKYFLNLNSGDYKLVVVSNISGIQINKTKIFHVLKYSGSSNYVINTPENPYYVFFVLIFVLFYLFLNRKNN